MHGCDPIPEHTYIYVIGCGGYRKIGYANDPKKRLKGIQTGNPRPCIIEYARPLLNVNVTAAEAAAHAELKAKRAQGEWFRCSLDQAIKAISRGCRRAIDARLHREGFFHDLYGDLYAELFGAAAIPDPRAPRTRLMGDG
jgi:hypothetical protein